MKKQKFVSLFRTITYRFLQKDQLINRDSGCEETPPSIIPASRETLMRTVMINHTEAFLISFTAKALIVVCCL